MINSKLWLVVNPSVGIPLFLGGVAVGSFAVHLAVVSNTDWVGNFLSGQDMASAEATVQTAKFAGDEARVYATSDDGIVVVLPDGRMAKAKFEKPLALNTE
ncbi:MAG: light-harvesting protein [Pseudomonadota bacterium]